MKVKCPRNFGKHFILSPQILSFVEKTSRHEKLTPFVLLCLALLSLGLSACSEKDDSVPRIQLAYENPNEVFDNENPRISLRAFETADRVYLIQGGDGNFRLEVSNEEVLQARCEGSKLFIRPLKAGKAEVLIRDGYGWDYLCRSRWVILIIFMA